MNLGKRIDKLRRQKNMSQAELCKGIISSSHLSNIKRGRYQPAKDILLMFAERLEVPTSYLLHHQIEQPQLKLLLTELHQSIVQKKRDEAKEILLTIRKQLWPISSTVLEFFFFVLESLYVLNFVSVKKAQKRFELEVVPLCEEKRVDQLPKEVRETYYSLKGRLAYHNEDFESSYESFTRQLTCTRDIYEKANVLFYLGASLAALCRRKEGIDVIQQAIALYEVNQQYDSLCQAYELLFQLYLNHAQVEQAEGVWCRLAEVVRKHRLTHFFPLIDQFAGILKKEKGQMYEAISIYQTAIASLESRTDRSPSSVHQLFSLYCLLVEAQIAVNDLEQAQSAFKAANQYQHLEGERIELMILKARLSYAKKDYEKYLALLDESLRYYYKQKKWLKVERYAQELAEFHFQARRYKWAAQYFKLSVEAIKHQR